VPLRRGLLTGKFHADRQLASLPRLRRRMIVLSNKNLDRTAPLIEAICEIAAAHQATIGQVALAWLVNYYGDTVVAIPGASKPYHADEAAGALKVALSKEELQRLAELSDLVSS
jgi:aryl-alcohol dehydrogenase-like predicted oxidoreductase